MKISMMLNSFGDYRKKVIERILEIERDSFEIVAGTQAFDKTVNVLTPNKISFKEVKNIYILERKFLIQKINILRFMFPDVVILDLNPRVINVWFILVLRRLINKKTILWGHAWPRAGKNSRTDKVRGILRKLSSGMIMYTKTQQEELQELMPWKRIFVAPNSLYRKDEIGFSVGNCGKNNIIYVGRLVRNKKPQILLDAFRKCLDRLHKNSKLEFFGDGPMKSKLQTLVRNDEALAYRVIFHGHVADYELLKAAYDRALVSVSPGYVGLSITQSFAFGVPIIISKDEPHSPEIESAVENENSLFFETDDAKSLKDVILKMFEEKDIWMKRGPDISLMCRNNYSVEVMAGNIIKAAKSV